MYPYQMEQRLQRNHYKGFLTYFKTMKKLFYSLTMMRQVGRQHKNVQNYYPLEKLKLLDLRSTKMLQKHCKQEIMRQ